MARAMAIIWATLVPGLQIYLFRRIRPDLIKNHVEGPKGFTNLLAPWLRSGLVRIVGNEEIRFWNGSKIYLCHCQHSKDIYRYQGAEIHLLLLEEATQFTPEMVNFLRTRVRVIGLDIPAKYKDMFPRIYYLTNPGNVGHSYFKENFVDKGPYEIWRARKDEGEMLRQYIPARIYDNPNLLKDDPGYLNRLEGMGSKELVKAFKDGDWNVIAGAYFDCFGPQHIIRPFEIPSWWLKYRSYDHGFADPFSHGWYAVSDGTVDDIPEGALVKYREWYGSVGANKGVRFDHHKVASGILARQTEDERFAYSVADRAFFKCDGGPSVAESFYGYGLNYGRADDTRITGWQQMYKALVGENGRPMLYFFETCKHTIRTIPLMQHHETKLEDVADGLEDHAADETRYAVMMRAYAAKKPEVKSIFREETFNEFVNAELGIDE